MPISEDEEMTLYEAFLCDPNTRLIRPAQDDTPSIDFKFDGGWRECRIWEGYFDASLILIRKALEEEPRGHNLIFPALFNLRHALEVALKWHIGHAGGVVPKHVGHNLDILISALRQTAYDLDDETTYIAESMLNYISELSLIDPRSVTFRYSTEANGSPIRISPQRWDLLRLYFMVDTLSLWFDGLSGQIDRTWLEQ